MKCTEILVCKMEYKLFDENDDFFCIQSDSNTNNFTILYSNLTKFGLYPFFDMLFQLV